MNVVLIVDRMWWAMGEIARQIEKHHPDINFITFESGYCAENPRVVKHFFQKADVVHWICPYAFHRLVGEFPTTASHCVTIHHLYPKRDYYSNIIAKKPRLAVVSAEWLSPVAERFSVPIKEITLISNGVDTGHFLPDQETKKIWPLKDEIGIGFVANLVNAQAPRKRPDLFIEIVDLLVNEIAIPVRVVTSGPGTHILKPYIERTGASFQHSLRERSSLPSLYNAMDVFLCTSEVEGGPLTILEAMACSIPCISTPVGLVPQTIQHEKNGFIVPKGKPQEFVKLISKLISDETFYHSVSTNARKTMLEYYDWCKTLTHVKLLYGANDKRIDSDSSIFQADISKIISEQLRSSLFDEALFLAKCGYRREALLKFIKAYKLKVIRFPVKKFAHFVNYLIRSMDIHGNRFLRETLG